MSHPAIDAIPGPLPQTIPTSFSWHPKISPYRLILMTTTIGLGTAKTIATQRGTTVAPITLEWITGTLIFLLSFSVTGYDTREDTAPLVLSWLFKPDCLDYVWSFVALHTDVNFPSYISGEKPTIRTLRRRHPPITPYRILVCSAVASFGMSKAVLGYYGRSTAMTWTDWALAVPVTTSLYVLGLYEYNSSNMWSSFFAVDYSEIFYSAGTVVQYTAGVLGCFAWCLAWGYMLWQTTHGPDWAIGSSLPRPDNYQITFRTRIEDACNFGTKLLTQSIMLVLILPGLLQALLLLHLIVHVVAAPGGLVRRALGVIPWLILLLVTKLLPSLAEDRQWTRRSSFSLLRRRIQSILSSVYSLIRIIACVFLILFCIVFWLSLGLTGLGLMIPIFDLIRRGFVIWRPPQYTQNPERSVPM